ncbi:hypothetical protein FSO04_37330 [Paraburkholderia madseniana]|uniref:Uncharacterized protein n=1 Tax=Paraburkholderia madseniana TaxID=2599607 RepID=A0A6N6W4E8_9BURK|nr:hypothetical protein [Paraburkholderia madseniana]KAE8754889.1 hypothetical protein FSO04_37330 [Paraburkholderia madseniana]
MTERDNDTAQRDTRDVRVDIAVNDVRERFGELVKTVRKTLADLQEATNSGGSAAHALRWFAQSDDVDPDLDTLAVELAIAAYNNRENAIWDPLDPRTYRGEADENSFLFQLLSKAPVSGEKADHDGRDVASDAAARAGHTLHTPATTTAPTARGTTQSGKGSSGTTGAKGTAGTTGTPDTPRTTGRPGAGGTTGNFDR